MPKTSAPVSGWKFQRPRREGSLRPTHFRIRHRPYRSTGNVQPLKARQKLWVAIPKPSAKGGRTWAQWSVTGLALAESCSYKQCSWIVSHQNHSNPFGPGMYVTIQETLHHYVSKEEMPRGEHDALCWPSAALFASRHHHSGPGMFSGALKRLLWRCMDCMVRLGVDNTYSKVVFPAQAQHRFGCFWQSCLLKPPTQAPPNKATWPILVFTANYRQAFGPTRCWSV